MLPLKEFYGWFQPKVLKHKLFFSKCLWISKFCQIFNFNDHWVIQLYFSEIPIWTHQWHLGSKLTVFWNWRNLVNQFCLNISFFSESQLSLSGLLCKVQNITVSFTMESCYIKFLYFLYLFLSSFESSFIITTPCFLKLRIQFFETFKVILKSCWEKKTISSISIKITEYVTNLIGQVKIILFFVLFHIETIKNYISLSHFYTADIQN
jgi:hypothetical protein